ncbi:hypothetical protein EEJ42_43205 [Streptomyces botrytidirepellens]|uniref:Uncharacterized protein n=1 Tax=Streptomyces botrytidirepellens TaxID=2486417 RepID=A0A3M8SX43_9ACTN|nr:hypothetical protein EEJ42_43205 [Streptomyces botrytidirepellens]
MGCCFAGQVQEAAANPGGIHGAAHGEGSAACVAGGVVLVVHYSAGAELMEDAQEKVPLSRPLATLHQESAATT